MQTPTKPRIYGLAAVIVVLLTLAITSGKLSTTQSAYADSAKVVSLYADGEKRIFTTDAGSVADLLSRTGIKLGVNDIVEPAADSKIPSGFFNVNVYRARPVLVELGAKSKIIETAYSSPRLIAEDAGFTTYPEDKYNDEFVTNFVGDGLVGEKVTVIPAKPVILSADGATKVVRTHAKTVAGLLADARIALGAEDKTSVEPTKVVVPGMDLTITRVADVTTTKHEVLPYATKTIKDPTLYVGQSQTSQIGSNGSRDVTYRIRYNDGVEVQRDILGVANQIDPVPQVTRVGSRVRFSGSVEYWRPLVEAAAAAHGVDPNLLLGIMKCESNGNASAINHDGPDYIGLFQYDLTTWVGAGGNAGNIYDGPTQITKTAWKIANYGTAPWNSSKHCWGR